MYYDVLLYGIPHRGTSGNTLRQSRGPTFWSFTPPPHYTHIDIRGSFAVLCGCKLSSSVWVTAVNMKNETQDFVMVHLQSSVNSEGEQLTDHTCGTSYPYIM